MKIEKKHKKNRIVFMLILIALTAAPVMSEKTNPKQKIVVEDTWGKMVICVEKPELDEVTQKQLDYLLKIPGLVNAITRDDFSNPATRQLKEKISSLLKNAAEIEPDECGKKYLDALSNNVLDDMFYVSLPELHTVKLNKTEIVFIPTTDPQEQRKFDTYIYVNDGEETRKIEEYTRRFDRIQENLPVKKAPVVPYTVNAPSIRIAWLIYSTRPEAFDLIYPTPTMFEQNNFPGRVSKIVIFKNLTDAYAESLLKTIGDRKIEETGIFTGNGGIDSESYLSNMALHRISHHIGTVFLIMPKKTKKNQEENDTGIDINTTRATKPGSDENELKLLSEVLGPSFMLVEELKTSAVALFTVSILKGEGLITPEKEILHYNTYLGSLLDRLRKGGGAVSDIIQFNYLLKKSAVSFNINTRKLSVQMPAFARKMAEFTKIALSQTADFYDAIKENSKIGAEINEILESLKDIPTQVKFQF